MAVNSDNDTLRSGIMTLASGVARTRQRRMLVLCGQEAWAHDCLEEFLSSVQENSLFIVSRQSVSPRHAVTDPEKVLQHLGTETRHVIWNGHDGLHPDAFGAAGGLVQGGGLMILLLPPLEHFTTVPDPDYLRMCSTEDELSRCGTRFLKRFVDILQSAPGCIVLEQQQTPAIATALIETGLASLRQEAPALDKKLKGDQSAALDAIFRVANGHRHRPLVITADRGRGKTSLLGIAAAHSGRRVLMTAPQKRSVQAAFDHYASSIEQLSNTKEASGTLSYIAPEVLAQGREKADLVFVDEAAALPVELLTRILSHYSRIVFSSTVHGYEGSGQGFALRFKRVLESRAPGWKQFYMQTPIRWSQPDLLEELLFDLLAMDAEPCNIPQSWLEQEWPAPDLTYRLVSQDELARNQSLLRQVMGLLVLAHYQTAPSDLRMLLDQPHFHILICEREAHVLGAALCVDESLATSPELHQDIIAGKRRLKGKLVPQALASFSLDAGLLQLHFLRIVRITVHPDLFGRGIGSKMLEVLNRFAKDQSHDFLAVSYGFSAPVYGFWRRAGFHTVRLGYRKDAASGTPSLISLKALDDVSDRLLRLKELFHKHLSYGLARYYREADWLLCRALICEDSHERVKFTPLEERNIQLFVSGYRSEFDCLSALDKLVQDCAPSEHLQALPEQWQQLLVMRITQQRDWQECVDACALRGKKEGLAILRKAIASLTESRCERVIET